MRLVKNWETFNGPGRTILILVHFVQLFDESWHKVTIGVAQNQATLYVDCEPVQGLFGQYYTPLEPRGPVDATGGYLSVARQVARPISVPVSKTLK